MVGRFNSSQQASPQGHRERFGRDAVLFFVAPNALGFASG